MQFFFNENVSLARMKVMAFGQVKLLRYQPNLTFCIVHDLRSIHHTLEYFYLPEKCLLDNA